MTTEKPRFAKGAGFMTEEDLERAKLSRERVYNNQWWEFYESVVRNTPHNVSLPAYIPIGELPQATGSGEHRREGL